MLKRCNTCKRVYKSEDDFFDGTSNWRICSNGHLWFNCSCESTLIISRGKYPWYDPAKLLPEQLESIFSKLSARREMPHLSQDVVALRDSFSSGEQDPQVMAEKVKSVPLLAAEILNEASIIARVRGVTHAGFKSLVHGISYLGQRHVSAMVLLAHLRAIRLETKVFSLERFWQQALTAASVAEMLAKKSNPLLPTDEVFLATALADVGKVIQAWYFPQEVDAIARQIKRKKSNTTWVECEDQLQAGMDHASLGGLACRIWRLPDFVCEAVHHHHDLKPSSSGPTSHIVHLAALSHQITHLLWGENNLVDDENMERAMEALAVDEFELQKILENQGLQIRQESVAA